MKKYEATDSKGRLHKRGTKDRTYRYVIVGYIQDDWPTYNGPTEASWASTYELAVARKKSFVSRGFKDVEIIAAEEV
jgi:hypothetical protein